MSEYSKKRRAEDNYESKKRKVESDTSGDEYEVEAIEKHKCVDGKYFYYVKWKGYDERTWEPTSNLNNCSEKLQEYKLFIRGQRQEQNKTKKGEHDDDASATTKSNNQRVVSKKDAKTINYKKFSNGSKYSLPIAFKISKGDAANNGQINNTYNKKNDSKDNGLADFTNSVAMPLEVRLPPFGPGDQSINSTNKPPKWYGVICRKRNEEEMNIGKVQITNYTGDSLENFPYSKQSKLVINRFISNNDLEGFLKDSFKKFHVYLVTVSTSLKDEISELDRLQSFLLKKLKVGVINTESLNLYLLPTSETSSELLDVEKPSNVNDLYFILQLHKDEVSNYLKSQSSSIKKYKSTKSTKQLTSHEAQQSNLPPSSTSPRQPNQKSFNSNLEISSNLDLQSPTKKHSMPSSSSSRPMQSSVQLNKEISNNLDIQLPSPKRHKSSAGKELYKVQQKNMLPTIQSLRPTHYLPKEIPKTIVVDEPVNFSINLNEFDGQNFTVIGLTYVENQKVITHLKKMGKNEVHAQDPCMDCIIFHQNELARGIYFKNNTVYKYNQIKFFLIFNENTTLTLREIFKTGGVILLTSVAIKIHENKSLDDYDMDSDRITFRSMECLIK
ncbi:1009_t:CDS:10 [Funneliformis geosporum]|uniref:6410_t:CDS:1 n=1 Tax=Funneliformis geosporum TaxID=1117311 RepID=A0A9W4SPF6_9GLOM|nr:1009_t:CDS:10 [Funneliformis geosporum]CAI2176836.1 6410_t:CDS:10 [Funneliformis geosporum]